MIKHTARSAAVGMRAAADAAVNDTQAQAWRSAAESLEAQRRKLSAEYCRLLEQHLGHAIEAIETAGDLRTHSRDALGKLARQQCIIDADTEPVSLRLQQRVLPLTEQRLTTLDSHLSAALGLQTVRPEINPFRPEIMCNALADLTVHHMARPKELERWLMYLAPPYAGGLKRLYIDLVERIRAQGIAPAKFQLDVGGAEAEASAPAARPAQSLPPAQPAVSPSQAAGLTPQHPRTRHAPALHELAEKTATAAQPPFSDTAAPMRAATPFPTMQELAHVLPAVSREAVRAFLREPNWQRDLDAPLPPSYYVLLTQAAQQFERVSANDVPPDAEALRRFHASRRARSPVDRSPLALDLQHWLSNEAWGRWASPVERARQVLLLKGEASLVSEVMGLDSTNLMLSQLGADVSLLWPVREAFLALSPALMPLAVERPWYLADEHHPVRRFIESVAQKSYEFNDEYAPVFEAFMAPVVQQVQALQGHADRDAAAIERAFVTALEALEQAWRAAEEGDPQTPNDSVRAVQFAQERQVLANEIAGELAQELEVMGRAPEPVVQFMLDTWSLVLAHAQLKDERRQRDPGGFRVAGMDLVWSLSGQAAVNDPVRAFTRLPTALAKLREGLEMIGASSQMIESTLSMLLPYHRRLLEMRRRKLMKEGRLPASEARDSAPDALSALAESDQPVDASRLRRSTRHAPWMSEAELSAAGLQTDGITRPGEFVSSGSDSLPGPHESGVDAEAIVRAMGYKDWFDMFTHGEWLRVQLIWCNDSRSLFMFQGRTGSPHSMTLRTCVKLIQQDLLRPVHGHASSRSRSVVNVLDSGHGVERHESATRLR